MGLELKKTARILIRLLERSPPDEVKNFIRNNMSKESVKDLLELANILYRYADMAVKAYASEIRDRAKRMKIQLTDHSKSCRKKKGWCFTCLSNVYGGRFKPHGPYWERKMNTNGERRDWRHVRDRELRDLLRQLDFTEEDIQDFEYAMDLRDHTSRLRNYYVITLKHLELIDEDDIAEIIEEKTIVGKQW